MSAEASRVPISPSASPKTLLGNAGSLDPIFNPKTVAIIGADETTIGRRTLSAFLSSEFRGSTFVVQPRQSSVRSSPASASVTELPSKVDLAVAVTSPAAAPGILAECVEKNVRGVLLISSGFGEKETPDAVGFMLWVLNVAECVEGGVAGLVGSGESGGAAW